MAVNPANLPNSIKNKLIRFRNAKQEKLNKSPLINPGSLDYQPVPSVAKYSFNESSDNNEMDDSLSDETLSEPQLEGDSETDINDTENNIVSDDYVGIDDEMITSFNGANKNSGVTGDHKQYKNGKLVMVNGEPVADNQENANPGEKQLDNNSSNSSQNQDKLLDGTTVNTFEKFGGAYSKIAGSIDKITDGAISKFAGKAIESTPQGKILSFAAKNPLATIIISFIIVFLSILMIVSLFGFARYYLCDLNYLTKLAITFSGSGEFCSNDLKIKVEDSNTNSQNTVPQGQ